MECKLAVSLEEYRYGTWIELPGGKTVGYGPKCKGLKVSTNAYTCQSVIQKNNFRTIVELWVEYDGAIDSHTGYSSTKTYYCE